MNLSLKRILAYDLGMYRSKTIRPNPIISSSYQINNEQSIYHVWYNKVMWFRILINSILIFFTLIATRFYEGRSD